MYIYLFLMLFYKVGRLMQPLLYDPKAAVRRGIMNIYNDRNSYDQNLVIFLQNEVERLMSPVLRFHSNRKVCIYVLPVSFLLDFFFFAFVIDTIIEIITKKVCRRIYFYSIITHLRSHMKSFKEVGLCLLVNSTTKMFSSSFINPPKVPTWRIM